MSPPHFVSLFGTPEEVKFLIFSVILFFSLYFVSIFLEISSSSNFFLLRFYFFFPFSLNFLSLMFLFIATLFTYLVLIYFENEVFYFVRILMVIFWSFLNPASFFFPEVAFFSLFEFQAFTLKAFLKCLVILYFPLIAKHGSL